MRLFFLALAPAAAYALSAHAATNARPTHTSKLIPRTTTPNMDETIIQKALAGQLEEEGAENVFLSELGWATYLDDQAASSYNLNQRPSMADDGYFTADVFSNPIDGKETCTTNITSSSYTQHPTHLETLLTC